MKNRAFNFFRSFFISPEILGALALLFVYQYFPSVFIEIGAWYAKNENWLIGVGINGGFLAFSLVQAKEVLFPINNSMNALKGWPDYILLKDKALIGVIFCVLAAIFSFFTFVLKTDIRSEHLGVIFLVNLSVPLLAIATLFLAQINIKIFIEQSQTSTNG